MKNYINWALRLVPAIILLQTLFFKFSAHPDSRSYFFLNFTPNHSGGFFWSFGANYCYINPKPENYFLGSIIRLFHNDRCYCFTHFILGIETNNDGGKLFYLALVVFVFVCNSFIKI